MVLLAACSAAGQPEAESTITPAPTKPATPQPGDLPGEIEYWKNALETNPEDSRAHYQLGLLYLVLDREQAPGHLQHAAELDPTLAPQVNRLESALRQSEVIDDPAYQLTIIGQALASVEAWPLAEAALEMAVAEDLEYAEAWAYLGEVRQQTGKENALDALETALKLDRSSYAANLFISFYWRRNDNPARAIPHLEMALRQDPNNLSLHEDLAFTLIQAGQVETAFENIDALLQASPEDPALWQILARLSIENDLQVAQVGVPAARQALLLEPDDPQSALMLGRAYLLADDPVLAERFLLKAAQQAPEAASAHLYLGFLYLNLENYPAAKDQLEMTLSLAESSADQVVYDQASRLLEQVFP